MPRRCKAAEPGTFRHRSLQPFGVEIDCDLSQPLDASEVTLFAALFRQHGLIIARAQSLTMTRQREVCGLLGLILDRAGETGTMSNEGGGPSAAELAWHADAAYTEHPFDALSLHALDVVDDASSTRFVSAERAWADLAPDLRRRLESCEQEMISPHYTQLSGRTCDRRDPEAQKRNLRPSVQVNPHNGRACLWISELQTARLLGMGWEESCALLNSVFDAVYVPDRIFEHRWRTGDLVIWDNIALQHMRGGLESVGRRVLQRVIVGTQGTAPHLAWGTLSRV